MGIGRSCASVDERRARLPTPRHSLPHKGGGNELLRDLRHVAAQDWREIAVHHGGIAATNELDERRDFMARRHLREAEIARERRDAPLVIAVAVGMHENDGDGADAVMLGLHKRGAGRVEVEFALDRAIGAHPFVDLDDALVKHVRLDDVARENLRPRLVADAQRVAEAAGDHQKRALALALEERVRRDRGAHLDGAETVGRDGLAGTKAEQVADAGDRRVAVGLGIFRKQFVSDEPAVGPPADHVGEGAAAVDPEFPPSGRVIHGL